MLTLRVSFLKHFLQILQTQNIHSYCDHRNFETGLQCGNVIADVGLGLTSFKIFILNGLVWKGISESYIKIDLSIY